MPFLRVHVHLGPETRFSVFDNLYVTLYGIEIHLSVRDDGVIAPISVNTGWFAPLSDGCHSSKALWGLRLTFEVQRKPRHRDWRTLKAGGVQDDELRAIDIVSLSQCHDITVTLGAVYSPRNEDGLLKQRFVTTAQAKEINGARHLTRSI